MKTLKQLMGISCLLLILWSCEKIAVPLERERPENQEVQFDAEVEKSLRRWVPDRFLYGKSRKFKASFFTAQDLSDPRLGVGSGDCEDPSYPFFNVQKGEGRASLLGNFTTEITFCVKPPAPGEFQIDYKDGHGTFYTEDGHELHIEIPVGVVKLIPPPSEFQAKFQDRFIITGGTGPYENARGVGITNSFVKFFPEGGDRTKHTWYALLILD